MDSETKLLFSLDEPYLQTWFSYNPPTEAARIQYEAIQNAANAFAQIILDNAPDCEDRQETLRLIRQAVMCANAAVAFASDDHHNLVIQRQMQDQLDEVADREMAKAKDELIDAQYAALKRLQAPRVPHQKNRPSKRSRRTRK